MLFDESFEKKKIGCGNKIAAALHQTLFFFSQA
jgi:hypothetical protein